jgi:hypothetical protein
VAYLPGLSMCRIADLYPGQAKTDARDAHIIADAARTMPHTLRRVDTGDETLTELGVLVGFDDDLAGEATRTSNRIRGLLTCSRPGTNTTRACASCLSAPIRALPPLPWIRHAATGDPLAQSVIDRAQRAGRSSGGPSHLHEKADRHRESARPTRSHRPTT